ncbi:hypothetical protein PROFUN_07853 [Planoprotostelium fungivorum]|uniref:Uncharacterized protein n=1 Tax=Planoprotostelium fungivorum TaxID=1890364 RepID=A0A2P6NLB2_9EUKA|nr:hypothetical protein PROFUN_07853 [Planoprotostelium fungivorum]
MEIPARAALSDGSELPFNGCHVEPASGTRGHSGPRLYRCNSSPVSVYRVSTQGTKLIELNELSSRDEERKFDLACHPRLPFASVGDFKELPVSEQNLFDGQHNNGQRWLTSGKLSVDTGGWRRFTKSQTNTSHHHATHITNITTETRSEGRLK